jgi:hypothetical protein
VFGVYQLVPRSSGGVKPIFIPFLTGLLNRIPVSTLNSLEIRLAIHAPAGITAGNLPPDA